MGSLEELQAAMVKHAFFPEKRFSQNFLIDDATVQKLVDVAHVSKKNTVLEIGGGTGIVTQKIAQTGAKVEVIELHRALLEVLRHKFAEHKHVHIIPGDVLKVDLHSMEFDTVIASPPYAISDDIMYALLERGFEKGVFVWQMEFAEKLLAPEGSSEYNALSVLTQYYFDGEIVQKISPKAFYPMPQQFSGILFLKRKRVQRIAHHKEFVHFVRTLFRFKNKTFANALKKSLQHIDFLPSYEDCMKLGEEARIEDEKVFLIHPKEFVRIFNALTPSLK